MEDWERSQHGLEPVLRSLQACFDTDLSDMPEPTEDAHDILKPEVLKKTKWKAAGPASNQRGAAAVALLVHDVATGFSNISKAWAGLFSQDLAQANLQAMCIGGYQDCTDRCCCFHLFLFVHSACGDTGVTIFGGRPFQTSF